MPAGATAAVGERAAFAALLLAIGVVGRSIVVDASSVVLVWPGAGLAVAWLITRSSRRGWVVDLPLIGLVGGLSSLLTGTDALTSVIVGVAGLLAVLVVVGALRWWAPAIAGEGTPPSSTPHLMLAFLAACSVGALAGVALGVLGLVAIDRTFAPGELLTWWGRNVCGIAAITAIALLIHDQLVRRRAPSAPSGGWAELAALFLATALLLLIDYASALPISFLLPAMAVWAGSRFRPIAVATHVLVAGGGFLMLTYLDHGPFTSMGDSRSSIALAQLFVAMTLVIGFLLAASRESSAALQADLLAQERAQNEELLTFARRVAHDVRNPLAVIESWTAELASALAAGPAGPPPGATTMIAGIERATARMGLLVDHLLADAAARGRPAEQAVVDLSAIVADVASEYDAATLDLSLDAPLVAGDPVMLRQLVDNLVGNAVKYVRPGQPPEIAISAVEQDGRVVVRVADRGVGVPEEALARIFEPFQRAHADAYPGTGLGLSMCRRIVERHGGSIRAAARGDGPGTVFQLDLPSPVEVPPTRVLAETGA